MVAGTPIEAGWVTLYPIAGTVGDPVSTPIQAGGKFHFRSAPVGVVAVRITLPRSHRQALTRSSPAVEGPLRLAAGPLTPFRGDTSAAGAVRFELLDQP